MNRNPQEIARVVQSVLRLAGPRASIGVLTALLLIGLAVALLAPGGAGPLLGGPSAAEPKRPAASTKSRDIEIGPQKQSERPSQTASQYLETLDPQTFRSPEGLVYGRGSEHGHRLKHLMAHAQDQPDRPGSHGVFDATEAINVLKLIDEGYRLAKSGKQTRTRREEGRTIYVVAMGRRIGYVGGESGARRGHPTATSLQLILDGDRFVTAYPIAPGR